MPILTKEVEVKPTGKMIQYYKDRGYDAIHKYPLMVNVGDLPKNSSSIVSVLCDICQENETTIAFYVYNKSVEATGSYACKKCRYEKIRQTSISRYGVDNYSKTKECHDKMKDTMMSLYGAEHYSQTKEHKEKYHNTCTDRYGESYGKQFTKRAIESFFDKTGYNNPSQSPEVKENMRQSCIEKYGVDNPIKSSEIKEKIVKSCIEHYGVDNPAKSPEVREKISKTLYTNSSQKASRQQLYIYNVYCVDNDNQPCLNYPISYYNADICLLGEKLDIEVDCGGHNLLVKLGKMTQEEFDRKEIVRNNIVKREGYKQMRIISSKDLLPSDTTLLQMLQDARNYFSDYPNHSWIEFSIDTSTVRNAEHKDGIPYDFGKLRTIKDSDLANQTNLTKGA